MAEDGALVLRRRPSHKLRYTIIALLCIGAAAWMLVLMQKNVVFFKTVSEAVGERAQDRTREFRIGGAVVPGSIHRGGSGTRFELTQGGKTVTIDHRGNEPTMFKDCAPVVANGRWNGITFVSDQLLIKHGSEYEAPAQASTRCPPDPFGKGS